MQEGGSVLGLRLFTQHGCGICLLAKQRLNEAHIEYEEVDIATEEGLVEAERLNLKSTGVLVDENDKIISIEDLLKQG